MKNIIFIAPPAAGKGTQSEMLEDKYNYFHISTGDIFREIIDSGTSLGEKVKNIINAGELVSDDIIIEIIENKLNEVGTQPFVLDGFPRTIAQANALNKLLNDKAINYEVIYLSLDEEIALKRTFGRLVCQCGKSYNKYDEALKPKVENVCDTCGSILSSRDDDNEESFRKRYKIFIENTNPILDLYEETNKLHTIDASQSAEEIFSKITEVI